jgi:multicomponent Na+:H+ antiporter subunit E
MATDRPRFKLPSGFISLSVLLTFLWFAANSSFAIEALLTGALISAALA